MTHTRPTLRCSLLALALLFVPLVLGASGCGDKPAPAPAPPPVVAPKRPRVVFETPKGPVEVAVVLARTPDETKRGLMFVDKLEAGRGMLFLMPTQRVQSFWMKNTYIALDMVFIDEAMKVVGIVEEAEPMTLSPRTVGVPSRYVLEVRGGWTKTAGIAKDQSVRFVDIDR